MDDRIAELEESLRRMKVFAGGTVLLVLLLVCQAFVSPSQQEIIRARGFVVVDEQGRERILIGAPIPPAKGRVRTDPARVRDVWAEGLPDPDRYMGYYAQYDHSMNGVLILDEHGFDRIALGSPTPDPNLGRRIGPATGLLINDAEGFERSGYGLLTVNGSDRVVLGLDSNQGTEALTLSVHDGGSVGVRIAGGGEALFLGRVPGGLTGAESGFPFTGLFIRSNDSLVYSAGTSNEGR